MQFFVVHGWYGVAAALVSMVLFIYTCSSLLSAGQRNDLRTNEDTFRYFCGPIIGVVITWYTMALIVAVNSVMLAGAAATLQQAYGVPTYAGAGAMAMLCLATLLLGLNRILSLLGIIGPLILLFTAATILMTLFTSTESVASGVASVSSFKLLRASDSWLFSSLLYVGLILPGLAGFLPVAGAKLHSSSEVRAVSLLGPLVFTGVLILLVIALMAKIHQIAGVEVPTMAMAAGILPVYARLFAVAIFLGIFTTITPLLWTVCTRFTSEHSAQYRGLAVCLTLVGLAGGTVLPFGVLLNWIYPTVGYVGLLFLVCQIVTDVRHRWG